jgi:hypothetical protein
LLATEAFLPFLSGVSVSVSGHIWRPNESVNAFLQFYFNRSENRRILGVSNGETVSMAPTHCATR